ncbi:carbohydrate porin [Lysobacter sp. A421]
MALCFAGQASAADDHYLLGDWDGARGRLADTGITFDIGYDSELAHNFSGGERQITRHADQWKFGTDLDLEKLWGWNGASFQVVMTHRSGNDLGSDAGIGNNQLLQEVYGRGQTWHLTVFALEQSFLANRLQWRIGRMTVGGDFAAFSCDFQNLTFCGSQPGNLVGDYWVNWPTSQWATRLKLDISKQMYLQVGAYQVNPKYIDDQYARENGWKLDFPGGTTGALVPLEFGWLPTTDGRPGSYKIGLWYDTSGGPDLFLDTRHQPLAITSGAPLHRDARYGGYINVEQQISGDSGQSGATVFLNATQADRATAATDRQIALGVQYAGPFGREQDTVGFAIGATHPNGRAADHQQLHNQLHPEDPGLVLDGNEYAAELIYAWRPIPGLTLRPNLQYVVHPGGSSRNSDALVVGLKSSLVF